MKKIVKVFLMSLMVLTLFGCGDSREKAQKATENMFKAIQTADMPTIEKYFGEEITSELGLENGEEAIKEYQDVLKMFVKNLKYKIVEATEEEDTAIVKVEITNTDMQIVMAEFIKEMLSEALSMAFLPAEKQPTEEELEAKYIEILTKVMNKEDLELVTNTVDINLSYVEDQWVIEPTDELIDSISGGLMTYAESMSNLAQ